MIRIICKLPLVACLLVLFITPAHADVSHEGLYITVTIILGILFLPDFIVAISHRTRKKLYLMVLILWAVAAFLYNMMELIVKNQTLNDFLQQKELLYPGLDMAAK